MKPIVWTIAGTDPSGGAGIQADLKTMNALGVHGCSVITAVIAQNTLGVRRIEYTPPHVIEAQLEVLREDLPPATIKIGMIGTPGAARVVGQALGRLRVFTVYDPVMKAGSGDALMEPDLPNAVRANLLPHVGLLTPNLPEAEHLIGRPIRGPEEMPEAARALLDLGVGAVLLKGGHLPDSDYCQDYWTDGRSSGWLTSPRQHVHHTHGTGCTLSSAIASFRALGYSLVDGIVLAKAYVNQGIRRGGGVGHGRGPLAHEGWPASPEDVPWLTPSAEGGRHRLVFPNCGPIGLYPIVDRAAWLEKLLPLGIRLIQLRAKDLEGEHLEQEVAAAVRTARACNAYLVINDRWDLAIRHGAWGVHLGQEDLTGADLEAVASAGLRLGISARSYSEIARALSVKPSYVALGSIFPTSSKSLDYEPIGLESFARMRRWLNVPVVAIGGITLEHAPLLLDAGADGIAVISDLRNAPDLAARVRAWQVVLGQSDAPHS